jgi:FKBP-type peptidyl-prolyl cis-trans isomerase SlyD
MKVDHGKIVTLDYTITTSKGEMIESSAGRGEPLVFLFGKSGIIPGLDEQLAGMGEGDEKEFDLPPEKAFGTAESGPVIELPKNRLPADATVTVGTMFQADLAGNNQTINMVVLEDRVNSIKVRVIHPLAGKTIHVKAKVLGVRDAKPEELGN